MLLCLSGCAQIVPALAGYGGLKFVEQVIAPAIANAQKAKQPVATTAPAVATTVPATSKPAAQTVSLPPKVHEALEVLPEVVRKVDEAYTGFKSGQWDTGIKGAVGAALALLGLLARWYYKNQPAPEQEIKLKQEKLNAKTDIKLAKLNGAKK